MKASEILSKAADLIEPEGKWCQHAYALTRYGIKVEANCSDAHCFCAYGAIDRLTETASEEASVMDVFKEVIGGEIEEWNDEEGRTQSEVVEKFRQAASLAKEREGA